MTEAEALITPRMLVWARKRRHWSLTRAAEEFGVSAPTLARWESGQERPTFKQAYTIATKLRIPFGYLWLSNPPKRHLFRWRLPWS